MGRGIGVQAGTQAAYACTLSTPSQVSGGRGRGGPADAHVAITGGGPEPQPPVDRKPVAAGGFGGAPDRARGPRAPGSPAGVAAVAGWPLPPADGGRRDPGSERGRGGESFPAAGSPELGELRGRRRGLGKDTCCTVLWMVVSGD